MTRTRCEQIYPDTMKLRDYTTAQLIEELARRANERDTKRPEHWCHECAHYVAWVDGSTPDKAMPDSYYPCTKGHKMRFMVPEEIGDEYGYYLPVCADRDVLPNTPETIKNEKRTFHDPSDT